MSADIVLQSKKVQQSDTIANFHVNHKMMETSRAYCSFYAFEDGLLKVLNTPSTVVVGVVTEQRMAWDSSSQAGASCDWQFSGNHH